MASTRSLVLCARNKHFVCLCVRLCVIEHSCGRTQRLVKVKGPGSCPEHFTNCFGVAMGQCHYADSVCSPRRRCGVGSGCIQCSSQPSSSSSCCCCCCCCCAASGAASPPQSEFVVHTQICSRNTQAAPWQELTGKKAIPPQSCPRIRPKFTSGLFLTEQNN